MRNISSMIGITILTLACTSDDSPMTGDTEGADTGTGSTGSTMTGASMTAGPTTDASTSTDPTTTADSTASDDATDGATGTVDDTTGDTGDTGVPGCAADDDCGGNEPFCVQGTCVTCTGVVSPNDACEGADPAAPFCVADACVPCSDDNAEATCVAENPDLPACLDGQCVQCSEANSSLCEGATPACVSGECAPCSFHSQCPASACQLFTGECLDATPQTIGPDPTHDFATLAAAFASVPAGGEAVFVVYNNAANAAYAESVQLSGDRVVALLGADGMRPIVQGTSDNHAIRVDTGATLLVENLRFSGFHPGGTLRPLEINAGRLALDRTEVVDNRATIRLLAGSEGRFRNTVIGVSYTSTPAVRVSASSLDVLYSTLVAEGPGVGIGSNVPAAIACDGAVAVNVRNSVLSNVHATTPSIADCDGVTTVTYSATREAQAGMGNVVVGDLDTGWFTNWPGDLRLSNAGGTEFADVAQWQAGDPPTDLDINLRPTVDGTADYAGGHRL